ncbi:hypothetical protein TBLA_0D02000 [Henningerozyma blattae CBS 6284]|uniref:MULE transposase domain-containing protein n=1 Tax=Henningerozyma blattae (strain ATCC 34711 / CBS 6284 / DSM 70876 / NBRC 10599 / NRRL Y-10934 / UCD 77-7) TaxID=1071380 RepID=I2H2V5_HENB6|nr:hypothetical protein TBLA_0D02000 [Tetrapisispora blattae CBS 6284]CCH60707.1 hypothetical protein TBLA_0D02000 [Tetrapisispora blattae CBS 6284]
MDISFLIFDPNKKPDNSQLPTSRENKIQSDQNRDPSVTNNSNSVEPDDQNQSLNQNIISGDSTPKQPHTPANSTQSSKVISQQLPWDPKFCRTIDFQASQTGFDDQLQDYDQILGPSDFFLPSKREKRVKKYLLGKFHTVSELTGYLKDKFNQKVLQLNIIATIPFNDFNLGFNPSVQEILNTFSFLFDQIETHLKIKLISNEFKDNLDKENSKYISVLKFCKDDIQISDGYNNNHIVKKPKLNGMDNYSTSQHIGTTAETSGNPIRFDCKSNFILESNTDFGFIQLTMKHDEHIPYHPLNIPEGLNSFIRSHYLLLRSELINNLKKNNEYNRFITTYKERARSYIENVWADETASTWRRHKVAFLSAIDLISTSKWSNYIQRITLPSSLINNSSYVSFEFKYPGFDKIFFGSAALTSVQNISKTFNNCHIVVGDYKGREFPIAVLFLAIEDTSQCIIESFLEVLKVKGYTFNYITTDLQLIHRNAIDKIFGSNTAQLCLWNVLKTIREVPSWDEYKVLLQEKKATNYLRRYPFYSQNYDKCIVPYLNSFMCPSVEEIEIVQNLMRQVSKIHKYFFNEINFENEKIYLKFVEDVFNELILKRKQIKYFFYLWSTFIQPSRFKLWVKMSHENIFPLRNTNLIIDLFFHKLEHIYPKRPSSVRIDTVIYVMIETLIDKYIPKIKLYSTVTNLHIKEMTNLINKFKIQIYDKINNISTKINSTIKKNNLKTTDKNKWNQSVLYAKPSLEDLGISEESENTNQHVEIVIDINSSSQRFSELSMNSEEYGDAFDIEEMRFSKDLELYNKLIETKDELFNEVTRDFTNLCCSCNRQQDNIYLLCIHLVYDFLRKYNWKYWDKLVTETYYCYTFPVVRNRFMECDGNGFSKNIVETEKEIKPEVEADIISEKEMITEEKMKTETKAANEKYVETLPEQRETNRENKTGIDQIRIENEQMIRIFNELSKLSNEIRNSFLTFIQEDFNYNSIKVSKYYMILKKLIQEIEAGKFKVTMDRPDWIPLEFWNTSVEIIKSYENI